MNYSNAGVFTGKIIRMISDIRAKYGKDSVNLLYCGKFTLAEDLSDISDMTSIDLSSIYSLEGGCCFEECSFPRMRTSALFLEEISTLRILLEFSRVARRTWRKFLEITSLHSNSLLAFLTHTHTRNYYFIGTLPGIVIKLISEGKANFNDCNEPFTLPTDLSSIKDIKKIDLSSLRDRLQGRKFPTFNLRPVRFFWENVLL